MPGGPYNFGPRENLSRIYGAPGALSDYSAKNEKGGSNKNSEPPSAVLYGFNGSRPFSIH
jgi:hypothetical protein